MTVSLTGILDCLDGAVARRRGQTTDLGGFLDLLSDFVVYSAIPICCASSLALDAEHTSVFRLWLAVAVTEATFHINNFVLFFVAAVMEKRKAEHSKAGKQTDASICELTSVSMRPALVEGSESGAIFTLMLAVPEWTETLCWILSVGVVAGTAQRVLWTVRALTLGG